jgi:hypothetical protein
MQVAVVGSSCLKVPFLILVVSNRHASTSRNTFLTHELLTLIPALVSACLVCLLALLLPLLVRLVRPPLPLGKLRKIETCWSALAAIWTGTPRSPSCWVVA